MGFKSCFLAIFNYISSYTQKIAIQYITVNYKKLDTKKLVLMN